MNRFALILLGLLLALAAAGSSVFVVQPEQYGAVYAMGKVERVLDAPGVYLKWPSPIENVVFVDRRVRSLRSAQADSVAGSGRDNLVLNWFVQWRVSDPASFLARFGDSEAAADDRLASAMRSSLNTDLGAMSLQAALAAQSGELSAKLRGQLADSLRGSGIEVLDAGLTQLDHSADVTDSVYRRMAAERKAQAQSTRAEGQAAADGIRAKADRQREQLLAEAYRKAQTLKGEGDAEAAAIDARAFGKDPEFADFYRSLQAYRASFDKRSDVMVLDPSSEFFRYLRQPAAEAPHSGARKH